MILHHNTRGEVLQFNPSYAIFLHLSKHRSPQEKMRSCIAKAIFKVQEKRGLKLTPQDYEALYASYEMMYMRAIELSSKMDLPDVVVAFMTQDHKLMITEILQSLQK